MKGSSKVYPPIYPDIKDWPIYKLYEKRSDFVKEIDESTLEHLLSKHGEDIDKVITRTTYLELIRLKESPWKVDPPNEKKFWKRIRREVLENNKHKPDIKFARNKDLLKRIINRYSEEIAGNFKLKTFKFARKFLTGFFRRLLNTAAGRNHRRIWGSKYELWDRIKVYGDVEKIRDVYKKGTVVILPTHFSNLDSVLIGYSLDQVLGLPSFSYGAGLNLYESEIFAFYMSRLGAYRVDRRKKNSIYLETLKCMSEMSLLRGTNSIFFPGGTRSRSGALETELKYGLLNSLVSAQRAIFERGSDQKIIVVPLILGYHFVLEAKALINNFLKKTGEENYVQPQRQDFGLRQVLRFAWKFFSESSDIILSFGDPIDVTGHLIDEDAISKDAHGNMIDIKEYFTHDGELKYNRQREYVYTRMLAKKLVEAYHQNNVVLSSHIVAYAGFEIVKKLNPELDIFGLLRIPAGSFVIPKELFMTILNQIRSQLFQLEKEGKIRIAEDIRGMSPEDLLKDGAKRLGVYHNHKALKIKKDGKIVSESFQFLFYYHNRLENYDLDKHIQWDPEIVDEALVLMEWE